MSFNTGKLHNLEGIWRGLSISWSCTSLVEAQCQGAFINIIHWTLIWRHIAPFPVLKKKTMKLFDNLPIIGGLSEKLLLWWEIGRFSRFLHIQRKTPIIGSSKTSCTKFILILGTKKFFQSLHKYFFNWNTSFYNPAPGTPNVNY